MTIQQIDETMYRVAIPVPFPMKYVYCYVFKEPDGWSIVDTGLNNNEAAKAWEDVFFSLGIEEDRVNAIVITHFHPDHFGLSGWLQEKTGAPVYISNTDEQMVHRVWGEGSRQAEKVGEMCREHGAPPELAKSIEHNMKRLSKFVHPLPKLTVLPENKITLGGNVWEIIETPGHSDGLICLYQREKHYLLAADHVLDKITPNISLWPDCDKNPLQNYFESLKKVQNLNVDITLTAHGNIVNHLAVRVEEIFVHHEKRLEQIEMLVNDGWTAYEVASYLFENRKLTTHQWRFAIAEIVAHLEYLVFEKRVVKEVKENKYVYMQKKAS
ncbi:MBL fold metallo-hydrolase [Domibacillus epiphyticus]|uniref:MBL fold metallo-hydrolase n=2 Tax=Domibacillus epiphyticus TaxID=1714355 RepID=A0A1V2A8Y6_9BACI|nr:MBL fold metallo-hydrolase [Domibacillus epiphyticus]OMP67322.1 MBL fold metallo-hydrolase [Domibacillus epiphyticus]